MSRALLVIDVQNEYFTGKLPISHPAGHLERILGAMDAAAWQVPTIVVQHHFPQPEMPFFQQTIQLAPNGQLGKIHTLHATVFKMLDN